MIFSLRFLHLIVILRDQALEAVLQRVHRSEELFFDSSFGDVQVFGDFSYGQLLVVLEDEYHPLLA